MSKICLSLNRDLNISELEVITSSCKKLLNIKNYQGMPTDVESITVCDGYDDFENRRGIEYHIIFTGFERVDLTQEEVNKIMGGKENGKTD